VIPFLHHHVATLQPPTAAAQRLEREFAAVARRSLTLTAALVDAVTALRGAGIGVTPFKGPALAVAAYGSIILRQFDNLDVLVHRADLPGAERVLTQYGYRSASVAAGSHSRTTWDRRRNEWSRRPVNVARGIAYSDSLPRLTLPVWKRP